MANPSPYGILVEAEDLNDYGGWLLDSQFEHEMGSPYLLAHGNGKPVSNATTVISVPKAGRYNLWVRAKDWVPSHHPGRFGLVINGSTLPQEFGANDKDLSWQRGGAVELAVGKTRFTLRDLTGFAGRCDAMFFSLDDVPPPEPVEDPRRTWRKQLRGLQSEPIPAGDFDVVVVGGGVVGAATALTAARLGERVALIQDRPVLGGNASVEIGLSPRGIRGPLIEELMDRHADGNIRAKRLLESERTATTFLHYTTYNTITKGSAIVSVDCRHDRTGQEVRLSAPTFIDCSGKCILGLLSGAQTLFGQESRAEYGDSLALEQGDNMHHGNTLFFRTRMAGSLVGFPDVPWATEVAKDYANLGEYGQWLDPYIQGEHIRDHLLRAVYGTFSNVKKLEPDTYANLNFDHVAFVAAQGGFARYKGDYILTETDIRTHKPFPDAVVQNDGAFCLHYPGDKYDF